MVKKFRPVVHWSNRASAYFKNIYERIKEDSYSNAEKVKEGITKIVDSLPDHPEKHPPDKYKKDNGGKYRAFEKYSYRVAYRISEKAITILRIRHVKQEPKKY